MKSATNFSATRKSHSATKSNDVDQVLSSRELKSNRRLSCASASCYFSRERVRNLVHFKAPFHDSTEDLNKADSGKKKLFLYASQVLVKLKKFSGDSEDSYRSLTKKDRDERACPGARKFKLSLRKVNFYYDLLKRLLEERCIFLLKEESRSCVQHTQKLVCDLKFLFVDEIIKLTTMPVKSYHRFVDSSGISISILEQLFKKVNYICDLHSSLKNNYQNIINFFHVGFDMELNQMLLKINKFQNHLYSEMLYWTHKVLEIFILKLCLADPESVSPEFLHHVLEICGSFNLLFFDKKEINYAYLMNSYNVLFNSFIQSDYETVLLDFILEYLSHFEAKVATEKIIQYLIYECKNYGHSTLRDQHSEKYKKDAFNSCSNTSDYYSASSSIAEDNPNLLHASINGTYNFENVFLSLIRRNQSLVLKYLYSIICLDVAVPSKNKSDNVGIYSETFTVNKSWNLPQTGYKNRSYLHLEERYWIRFWDKILSLCLKLILEVPCHQYGNAAAGVFLLWPQSYHHIIFNLLKSSSENKDISISGLNVIKQVLHHLVVHTLQESWDKNMSSALPMIHGQHTMPVPVAENRARTRIGNALCLCLKSFETSFVCDSTMSENLYLQLFYPFQVTLDCFAYLTNIKTRASVSSSDLTTFLLISRSDCVCALKLLEEGESSGIIKHLEHVNFFSSLNIGISTQIQALAGHISEAPTVVYNIISDVTRETCRYKFQRNHWRISNCINAFETEISPFSSLNEVLNSLSDSVDNVYNGIDIASSATSAIGAALLSVLQEFQKNISSKEIQTIRAVLNLFLEWIEVLNIEETEKEKLKDMKCLKKLLCIVRILESLSTKPRYFKGVRNKVSPVIIDVNPEDCMILTEDERLHWQTCTRRKCFPCS